MKDLYAPILPEIEAVKARLKQVLINSQNDTFRDIGAHVCERHGKMLRSAFTILSHHMVGHHHGINPKQNNDIITLATSLECIHLASLIHDDIIDDADQRRDQPSIYGKWGTNTAIVSGVFVYASALEQVVSLQNHEILRCISESVKILCEGEMSQLSDRHRRATLADYFKMVEQKTAVLFGAAGFTGGYLATQDLESARMCQSIGQDLGVMFQITDDYLDLFGDSADLGKTPGQDLISGEYTYPFLLLLDSLSESDKTVVLDGVINKDPSVADLIQSRHSDRLELETRETIKRYADRVESTLAKFSDSPSRDNLLQISRKIAERCFLETSRKPAG